MNKTIGLMLAVMLILVVGCTTVDIENEMNVNADGVVDSKLTLTFEDGFWRQTFFEAAEADLYTKVGNNKLVSEFKLNDELYNFETSGFWIRRTYKFEVESTISEELNDDEYLDLDVKNIINMPGTITEVSSNCEIINEQAVCNAGHNEVNTVKSMCWFC